MITIRIGDGQTTSGKILDGSTEWYTDKEFDHAIEAALKTNKQIWIRSANRAYHPISLEQLIKLSKNINNQFYI